MAPRIDASKALDLLTRSAAASGSPEPGPEVVGASGGRSRASTRKVGSGDDGSTPRSGGESSPAATAKTPRVGETRRIEGTCGCDRHVSSRSPARDAGRSPSRLDGRRGVLGEETHDGVRQVPANPRGGRGRARRSVLRRSRATPSPASVADSTSSGPATPSSAGFDAASSTSGRSRQPHRRWEAYVSLEGVPHDVKLDGFPAQNRTIEGDVVVIAVDPIASWPILDDKNGTPRRRSDRPGAARAPSADADDAGWTPARGGGGGGGGGGDSPWWNRDETDANDPRDDNYWETVEDEDYGEDDLTLAADDGDD